MSDIQELYTLFGQGHFQAVLERGRAIDTLEAAVPTARAAVYLGEFALAEQLLAPFPPDANPQVEAERLTIQGVLRAYLYSDVQGYHQLALQAVQLAPTFLTLFSMGKALPASESLPYLREAYSRAQYSWEEAQAASGLSNAMNLLGRFREAFHYASLARLRQPTPIHLFEWASATLWGNDEVSLDELLRELLPFAEHPNPNFRGMARHLLARIYLLKGDLSQAAWAFEPVPSLLGPPRLPMVALTGVQIYRALGQAEQVESLVAACETVARQAPSPFFLPFAALLRGVALYPAPEARGFLERAYTGFEREPVHLALTALFLLGKLDDQPLLQSYQDLLGQWSVRAQSMLPEIGGAPTQNGYRLQLLGQSRLTGPRGLVLLRPRGMEILALLLMEPDGWDSRDLIAALYGPNGRLASLKTEIQRLREVFPGVISARPWRLTLPIEADFIQLERRLNEGHLGAALNLYQGPLLPHSQAPAIELLRTRLEERLKTAVIKAGDPILLWRLAELIPGDLELWEALDRLLPAQDLRRPVVTTHMQRLKQVLEI